MIVQERISFGHLQTGFSETWYDGKHRYILHFDTCVV